LRSKDVSDKIEASDGEADQETKHLHVAQQAPKALSDATQKEAHELLYEQQIVPEQTRPKGLKTQPRTQKGKDPAVFWRSRQVNEGPFSDANLLHIGRCDGPHMPKLPDSNSRLQGRMHWNAQNGGLPMPKQFSSNHHATLFE